LVADGPASWGNASTISDLIGFILRREYGSTNLQIDGPDVPWTTNVAACFTTIARSWLWVGAFGGCAMLAVRIWRPAHESRWAWGLLATSFALTGPLLAARFNADPHGIGLWLVQRFHILPALLLAIPVSAAADYACSRFVRAEAASALAALAFVLLSLAAVPALARVRSPAVELGARNLLRSLPRDAIVVVTGDDLCFGGRYLQLARGERSDVTMICSGLIPARWYRARMLGIPATTGPSLAAALLGTQRPLFVDPSLTRVLTMYPNYPFGIVMRVLPVGALVPSAGQIADINRDLYRMFDLDYPRPGHNDEYAAIVHHRYAASWAAIARRLDAEGDRAGALEAFDLTGVYMPSDD
jgi:hypothetical protein